MALLAVLSIPALAAEHTVPASARPDEIVVMVDDLGAIDDRILERLPNIKALFLENGLQYDDAYSETPLCCPGRASFLTGQHTAHHGVVMNDARLLDPSHTIATRSTMRATTRRWSASTSMARHSSTSTSRRAGTT